MVVAVIVLSKVYMLAVGKKKYRPRVLCHEAMSNARSLLPLGHSATGTMYSTGGCRHKGLNPSVGLSSA